MLGAGPGTPATTSMASACFEACCQLATGAGVGVSLFLDVGWCDNSFQITLTISFAHHVRSCLRAQLFISVCSSQSRTDTCWWISAIFTSLESIAFGSSTQILDVGWLALGLVVWNVTSRHFTPVEAPIKNTFIHFDEQQPDSVLWWQSGSNVVERVGKVVSQTGLFRNFIIVRKQKNTQISWAKSVAEWSCSEIFLNNNLFIGFGNKVAWRQNYFLNEDLGMGKVGLAKLCCRKVVGGICLAKFSWRSLLAKVLSKFVWVCGEICGERSAKFSTFSFATKKIPPKLHRKLHKTLHRKLHNKVHQIPPFPPKWIFSGWNKGQGPLEVAVFWRASRFSAVQVGLGTDSWPVVCCIWFFFHLKKLCAHFWLPLRAKISTNLPINAIWTADHRNPQPRE